MQNTKNSIRALLALGLMLACAATPAAEKPSPVGNTIVIGQSGVYSGPLGAYAQDNIAVINTYFESINEKGGIHGRKLKLVALDDGFDPKRTVENTKTLIEKEKAFALFNVIGTANNAAIYPLVAEHGIPLVGPYTGATVLRDPARFRYLFFTRASYADETEKMIEQLVSTGVKDIAIVYQDDPFGKAGLQAASEALERRKLKPVSVGAFNIAKLEETAAAAEAVLKGSPAAVIIASSGKGTTSFIKEVNKRGQRPAFYCLSVTNPKQLWADLGQDAHGIVVAQAAPSPWRATLPLIREYHQIKTKLNSKDYSYGNLEGFIVAKVAVEALRRAGRDLTREKYLAALEAMQDYDLGGYTIGFGPAKRSGSSYVDLTIIGRDGQFLR
jgi:branched-chain amino acid transport system substrate-binding protein